MWHAEAVSPEPPHIVFFDGVCGLCDRFVQFVITRDRQARFRFAPLQGQLAARELPPRGANPEDLDTIYVLTAGGELLRRSRAVFFVLRALGGAWRALALLRFFPAFLTDRAYDVVARVRYRIFGRYDQCRLPTPAERARVLD